MSAPTLDRHPGSSQSGPSAGDRRRRKQLVLVASALIVLAVAVGTGLAVATRPVDRQAAQAGPAPAAAAGDQNANAGQDQTAQPDQNVAAPPATEQGSSADPAGTDGTAPALEDGEHPAYITKVSSSQLVVDVVQVFHDDAAVKAAIADGKPPADARYLTTWVRNENSRLRTLPLVGDLDIRLRDACGDPGDDRQALLTKLAANAKLKGTYYYLLTVENGKVERIQERLAVNAC
jgi:cytoskeletal protein RodZ